MCVTFFGSGMQSGGLATRYENQKQISKTQHNKKQATNFKHKYAPISCIHVSFGINQQLAYFHVTNRGSEMQSGVLTTRTENQKQISTQSNTKQTTIFKLKYAPVCRIHISFGINHQLARFHVTIRDII